MLVQRDNISRCIYLHQVLYVYVKIRLYIYQDLHTRKTRFQYTHQDLRTRSACEYIKFNNKY